MRILVHEFVTGGGFAGRKVPASLAREGSAMLTALLADLAAIRLHQILTTADPRFPRVVPAGVKVATLALGDATLLDDLIASVDAVWLIAPETDRCLERLASQVEQKGRALLGPGAAAIRRASDKADLSRLLARQGVPHPMTRVLPPGANWRVAAREIDYPVVVKPRRGAGCKGVCLARDARELRQAVTMARRATEGGPLLLQRYVAGVAASVSLLTDGSQAVVLTLNSQRVHASRPFSYRGGTTPFDHPLHGRAIETALLTCQAVPGLRGYVGVDMVLTESEAVVIEVNPRVTTAYLGVRSALDGNVAALTLAACAGAVPVPPRARRRVRFTAAGRITSTAL